MLAPRSYHPGRYTVQVQGSVVVEMAGPGSRSCQQGSSRLGAAWLILEGPGLIFPGPVEAKVSAWNHGAPLVLTSHILWRTNPQEENERKHITKSQEPLLRALTIDYASYSRFFS